MYRLPTSLAVALVLCGPMAAWADESVAPPGAGRMLQQLAEEDWILRAEALHYVGTHRLADASEPVREILRNESLQPWVRGHALVTLARDPRRSAMFRERRLKRWKHSPPMSMTRR